MLTVVVSEKKFSRNQNVNKVSPRTVKLKTKNCTYSSIR